MTDTFHAAWAKSTMKPCVFCGKVTARYREINPPDDSTRVFKWVCGTTCLANWSTGQPKPERAHDQSRIT